MSSYLNCVIEKLDEKTGKWMPFDNKVYSHFHASARDIISGTGNFMEYEYSFKQGLPNDIHEETKKLVHEHSYNHCWLNALNYQGFLSYLSKKQHELDTHECRYSSVSTYLSDVFQKSTIPMNTLDDIKKCLKAIIEYLDDKYSVNSANEEELSTLNYAIKEFEYIDSIIDFSDWGGVEYNTFRIIFFVD